MSDVSGAPRAQGIGITIKYGKGYESTWATFTGLAHEVREQIVAYFGFNPEAVKDLTLSELVVNATSVAHGKGNMAAVLGAVAIPASQEGVESTPPASSESAGGDPWAGVDDTTSAPAEPAANPLYAQIEAATSVDQLKELWAENQAAFADTELMAAWKTKGKSLS
jgi:hypothetical protein